MNCCFGDLVNRRLPCLIRPKLNCLALAQSTVFDGNVTITVRMLYTHSEALETKAQS